MELNIESLFPGIFSNFLKPVLGRLTLANALLGGILFLLILILFVLCCCCRRLTNIFDCQPEAA